jgi:hypothetical protein
MFTFCMTENKNIHCIIFHLNCAYLQESELLRVQREFAQARQTWDAERLQWDAERRSISEGAQFGRDRDSLATRELEAAQRKISDLEALLEAIESATTYAMPAFAYEL